MYDHKDARPFSELLPWLFLCDDNKTVVNKDSSLMAVFEFSGVDIESGDSFVVENAAVQLDAAIRQLGEHSARIWTRCDRIAAPRAEPEHLFNKTAQKINDLWVASQDKSLWSNVYTLAIALPTQRARRTVAEMARDNIDSGMSVAKAMAASLKAKFRGDPKDQIGFETKDELDNARLRLEQLLISPLKNTLHLCGLRRLEGDELCGYLKFCTSTGAPGELAVNEFTYLDAALSDTWIDNRARDYLLLEGPRREYAAVLTLKDAPPSNRMAVLDVLMALPIPLTVANCWKANTKDKSISELKNARTFDEMRQLDFRSMFRGVMKNEGTLLSDDTEPKTAVGKAAMLYIDGIKNGSDVWGYLATSIIVRAESEVALERHVERIAQIVGQARLSFLREREGAICGFAAAIPGNVADPVRWFHTEASNLTDLAPIVTLNPGDPQHELFSKLARAPMPAHLTAKTRYGTPCHVNYHVGESGHALYIGPTRAGKTLEKMLMTSQGFKFPNFRSIIFDKDFSCQAATLIHDGDWINMSESTAGGVTNMPRMNPLAWINKPGGLTWLVNWIDRLMAHRGERLTEAEMEVVSQALERLKPSDATGTRAAPVRLSSLVTQINSKTLKDRLSIWCEGGAYGHYFDNEVDELDFSSITCFEIGGLITMGLTDVLKAFTEYVFFRVEQLVSAQTDAERIGPIEIYFEEAGFLLEDPLFAERAVDYLMTLAKKHAYLVMTAQSPEPFMRNERLRAAVRDNVSTVVFLPNANAVRDDLSVLYKGAFGLNDNHLELIAKAAPKKEYCIWHPQISEFRVAVIEMSKPVVAHLMSNKSSLAVLADTYNPDDPDWKERYVNRVMKEVL